MKNMKQSVMSLLLLAGLLASQGYGDLGLSQVLSEQGVRAVGDAVKSAADAVYAENDDAEKIQGALTDILNEAAKTENQDVMRYAVVAVMMAGGLENLSVGEAAINSSEIFNSNAELVALTVTQAKGLLGAVAENSATFGGSDESGGGQGGGVTGLQGGGVSSNPFDSDSSVGGGDDASSTPITVI
jgi:hypothetical protein